jgi:molybdate transport system substrate-binding protein
MSGRQLSIWFAVVVSLACVRPVGAEVVVSAASSLTEVLTAVAASYQQATGERVRLNLGASNTLARQIASGARVDVFISADQAQMNRVTADILAGTRVDLLTNQLAVAVRGDGASLRRVEGLLDAGVRRVAIGDPAAVPAGVYAKQYLESRGLWLRLQSKLVPVGSARLALAAVESGAADAAIVYATDVAAARGARTALVVPVAEGPRIVYPAAVMRDAPNLTSGRRFLEFLQGRLAATIFTAAGFGTAAGNRQP